MTKVAEMTAVIARMLLVIHSVVIEDRHRLCRKDSSTWRALLAH